MNITFGVPSARTIKKEEKFPDISVVTMKATQKGFAKKLEFNAMAVKEMDLENEDSKVSVSFSEDKIILVNTTKCSDLVEKYNLTKGTPKSFSNSKVYSHISKVLELNEEVDNEFIARKMEGSDFEGNPLFNLEVIRFETGVKDYLEDQNDIGFKELPDEDEAAVMNETIEETQALNSEKF